MEQKFHGEQRFQPADPPAHLRQNHLQLRKIYGKKCKKTSPPQEILPIQECLQLLQEEYGCHENTRRTSTLSLLDFHSMSSIIYLLLCPQQASNSKAFVEEIRRVCRRYGYSVHRSLFLVEFAHSKPLFRTVMALLADILKVFDSPCISRRDFMPESGVTQSKRDPNTMLDSLYSPSPEFRSEGDGQSDCDQDQVNLVSIKRLKNAVKTDLRRHKIYLRSFESRLRGLERRAETVSKDLEKANLALEALKRGSPTVKDLRDQAPCWPSGSAHEASHRLAFWPVADDIQKDFKRSRSPVWCEHLLDSNGDSPITKPRKQSGRPGKDPPSTRTERSGFARAGVFQCQAQVDVLMEMVNLQINQKEIDIIAHSKNLAQMRRVRRTERKNKTITV